MKTLFIPAIIIRQNLDEDNISAISKKLPRNIVIAYSIQYMNIAKEIKQILSKDHKITSFIQVLGCSKPKLTKKTQAILFIGDGKFHAVSLALETKLPIYILYNNELTKIPDKEIEILEKRKKGAYLKFLNSKNIGILVSIKPGQQNLKKAIDVKNKIKNKNSYIFIADNINANEFENFPQINSWINTACPRLDMNEIPVVNIREIKWKSQLKR